MKTMQRNKVLWAIAGAATSLILLSGCANTPYTWGGGLGLMGNCSNFKDPSLFTGSESHNNIGGRIYGKFDPGMRERIVVEGGYTQLGDTEFDGLFTDVEDTGKIKTDIVEFNVGYRYPFNDRFSAGGRVGAAYVDVSETEVFGGEPYSASASEMIPYGGLTARYAVDSKWGVSLFYDHYPNVGKADRTGEGHAHAFGVTVDVRFGGKNSDE